MCPSLSLSHYSLWQATFANVKIDKEWKKRLKAITILENWCLPYRASHLFALNFVIAFTTKIVNVYLPPHSHTASAHHHIRLFAVCISTSQIRCKKIINRVIFYSSSASSFVYCHAPPYILLHRAKKTL